MASRDAEPPNAGGTKETGVRSRRAVKLTPKALQNAVEDKQKEIRKSRKRLLSVMKLVEELSEESEIETVARDLAVASEEFGKLLRELLDLYEQDSHGDHVGEAQLDEENHILERALLLVDKLKNRISRQSSKLLELRSVSSRRSSRRSSASKTSSTIARLQALADAKAAKEEAQYTRLIAQKELERRTRDAEAERIRQQEIAQFESEIAILGADKKAAIANAKLKVFEDALLKEDLEKESELPEFKLPKVKTEERTSQWVHSSPMLGPLPTGNSSRHEREHDPSSKPEETKSEQTKPLLPAVPKLETSEKTPQQQKPFLPNPDPPDQNNEDRREHRNTAFDRQPLTASTPFKDMTGSQLIDSLTVVNQQIVAGLARQNLPKCQPDVFSGDPTLFHPWRSAFKAMLMDTDVSPTQEINYLRSFTSGAPQRLVDNYRKRQMRDPVALLRDLWVELEKRFGSAAVISSTLLECLRNTATFGDQENDKLQQFADLCADIESQVTFLPGLACLNYPSAIQPIAEKLPLFVRTKWEKEIANYSDNHRGTYPPFSRFSKIVQEQAKTKNNPNILAGKDRAHVFPPKRRERDHKTLKTGIRPPAENKKFPEKKRRRCRERTRRRANIAPIMKAAHTTYRSVRRSQQKPWKSAHSG